MRVQTKDAHVAAIGVSRPYVDAALHLCALALVAGGIHSVAATDHLGGHPLHGSLLLAIAVAQVGWGARIYAAPAPRGFQAGIALSAGVMATWLVSRTTGLPVGPDAWHPEAAGVSDLAATTLEALIVVMCAAFLAASGRGGSGRALPAPWGRLRTPTLVAMTAGLLAAFIGGGHSH